jgi:hypothetical protein
MSPAQLSHLLQRLVGSSEFSMPKRSSGQPQLVFRTCRIMRRGILPRLQALALIQTLKKVFQSAHRQKSSG